VPGLVDGGGSAAVEAGLRLSEMADDAVLSFENWRNLDDGNGNFPVFWEDVWLRVIQAMPDRG
jgi:hypothetical protein